VKIKRNFVGVSICFVAVGQVDTRGRRPFIFNPLYGGIRSNYYRLNNFVSSGKKPDLMVIPNRTTVTNPLFSRMAAIMLLRSGSQK